MTLCVSTLGQNNVPDGLLDEFTKETGIKVIVSSLEDQTRQCALHSKTQGESGMAMMLSHLLTSLFLKWHAKEC